MAQLPPRSPAPAPRRVRRPLAGGFVNKVFRRGSQKPEEGRAAQTKFGQLPGRENKLREIWQRSGRGPAAGAAAIARFGGRRRSCRGQPPHSDGGRAGPAAAAAAAAPAGHGSGGGSGGRRGPVTGSRPGPGHHEPRPPPRGEQRARGQGPPHEAALPVRGRGVRAAAGGSGRRGGGAAAGGAGVRGGAGGRGRAGSGVGAGPGGGRGRGAHVEAAPGPEPGAGAELCGLRR